jgi:hypothetical protein
MTSSSNIIGHEPFKARLSESRFCFSFLLNYQASINNFKNHVHGASYLSLKLMHALAGT